MSARRLPQNSNQALIPSGPLLKPSPKPIPPEVVVTGISASTIGGGILTAVLVAMPTSMGTDDAWTKEDSDNLNELEGKESTRTLTPGEKRRLEALRDKWFKFNPVMKTQWGWTSTPVWKDLAKIIRTGGTITELAGKVPSKVEAIRLIRETGGRIERIEGPHAFPNPHNYNHINYTTSSGNKGTIKIQEL